MGAAWRAGAGEGAVKTSPGRTARWRHDFKNQLGIIVGFSEVLLGELDESDPHFQDVEEIHKAARRALDLLADLELAQGDEDA